MDLNKLLYREGLRETVLTSGREISTCKSFAMDFQMLIIPAIAGILTIFFGMVTINTRLVVYGNVPF